MTIRVMATDPETERLIDRISAGYSVNVLEEALRSFDRAKNPNLWAMMLAQLGLARSVEKMRDEIYRLEAKVSVVVGHISADAETTRQMTRPGYPKSPQRSEREPD